MRIIWRRSCPGVQVTHEGSPMHQGTCVLLEILHCSAMFPVSQSCAFCVVLDAQPPSQQHFINVPVTVHLQIRTFCASCCVFVGDFCQ